MKVRIAITICAAYYYECVGRPIDPNIMEWIQIKNSKLLIKIQYNRSNPDYPPEFRQTIPVMKLLDLIHNHLQRKLGTRKITLSSVVTTSVVHNIFGDIIPNLPQYKDTEWSHKELIFHASYNLWYEKDNDTRILLLTPCILTQDMPR